MIKPAKMQRDKETNGRAKDLDSLTLIGCFPLTVLGISLIQVGEAGPQL